MSNPPTLAERLLAVDAGHCADLLPLYAGITRAAAVIAAVLRRGELGGALGVTGDVNVHGETVKVMDDVANRAFIEAFKPGADHALAGIVSEEMEAPHLIAADGRYFLMIDPLDGSSNIDNNITVGTIFSILPHPRPGQPPVLNDFLRPGRTQLAAGYVMYGSATLLVTTLGDGVDIFTLDDRDGEFRLTCANLKITEGATYSLNDSGYPRWTPAIRKVADGLRSGKLLGEKTNARYVGSLIADAHRTLLHGGLFFYPGEEKKPAGKLRLLYEACPMALLYERAGGAATDGRVPILDIMPTDIHQRTPLLLGDKSAVEKVMGML
jgi:fructose-1,6-bisphosphatase